MKYLIHNSTLSSENELFLSPYNRAFAYGDGIFETMIFRNGKISFLQDHRLRLSEGLALLDICLPSALLDSILQKEVPLLIEKNNLAPQAVRIKLQVWRKEGGLVTPESSEADYLLQVSPHRQAPEVKSRAIVAESTRLSAHTLSKFKTLNFLPYIQAGIEKKKRGADEIILMDQEGNISECSIGNIFWEKAGILYTPSLATGCIEGIMRKQILEVCKQQNIFVAEGKFSVAELTAASTIFTSNVSGLSLIGFLEQKPLNQFSSIFQTIKENIPEIN
jgi:4-amino-4-deoxychorismate lyase